MQKGSLCLLLLAFSAKLFAAPEKVAIYYFYDPINDSYTFTNTCLDIRKCRPIMVRKGKVKHRRGYRLRPGKESSYDNFIRKASRKYNVDFYLIKSLIKAESLFDSRALSTAGARGLMQLMPQTAKHLGVADSFSPIQNIMGGTKYLRKLLDRFKDPELALAAYNAGPAAVTFYSGIPPFKETRNYIKKIKRFYFQYTRKLL